MEKSYFKIFFSKNKETKWLNTMGEQGYFLYKIRPFKYSFKHTNESVYNYSVEYLNCSSQSNKALEQIKSRCSQGAIYIGYKNDWAYYALKNDTFAVNENIMKNNRIVYFWRSLYLFFFALVASLITGYQIHAAFFLNEIGYGGKTVVFFAIFIPVAIIAIITLSVFFGLNFTEYLNYLTFNRKER